MYKHPILRNKTFVASIWFFTALVACLLKLPKENPYNNFVIFCKSFSHTIEQLPLYAYYPKEYSDQFLYGISFTPIIIPFTFFTPFIGMTIWCLANSLVLYISIRMLKLNDWKSAFVILFCANELFTAVLMQQYNIAIAGFIILSFVFTERKKEFWAAFMIALGTLTKIYGIVGLAFFLFSKRRVVFAKSLLFWFAVLFALPMLYTSPEYVIGEYGHWIEIIMDKNGKNLFTDYTNISLLGMVRKISGVATYSDLWLIIPGLLLFTTPYLRINQYDNKQFRLYFLISALLFLVLFSTGTENSGYIAAMVAVCLWYVCTPTRKTTPILNTSLFIFCLILTSLSPTDLFPRFIRKTYIMPYALKALPCILIWFKVVWEQLTLDFSDKQAIRLSIPHNLTSIDIILPCFNPREGWEKMMVQKYRELNQALPGKDIRFIVANDASSKRFTAEAQEFLLQNIPNTTIVNNKENKGKGAAIRSGLPYATSDITLYTDYDFPYHIKSITQMVRLLEDGYDVVIATRNHTYYENLTIKRKIMSYASRILNFILLGLTHTDTQGGLKGFNKRGKTFLAATRTNRFLFDTEFIYKASLDNNVQIKDMPADLRENVHLSNMGNGVIIEELKNLFLIANRA